MTRDRFHPRPRLRRWTALLAAATGVAMTGVAVSSAAAFPASGQDDHLQRFEHQAIAWHDCRNNPNDPIAADLAAVGAVCGEITVPLDYRHPDGRTLSIAVDRRPATDTAHRVGTLVVNEDDAARWGVEQIVEQSPAVAARYDLVSFDYRFFGLSTPLDCALSPNLNAHVLFDATPDRASFDTRVAFARQAAAACAHNADVLPFASDRNVARDTDILRAALGEQRVSYVTWDRGGYQGAVYAQMFGQHVDRMVLDSAPDPNLFGPFVGLHNAPPAAAQLAHWAEWTGRHDAQYHLGTSTAGVLHTIQVINDATRRAPLRVGQYLVTTAMVPLLVTQNKDDSDAAYASVAVSVGFLRDAANGQAVTPTGQLAGQLRAYYDTTPRSDDNAGEAFYCGDRAAPRDPEFYWRDIQSHLATEPFYGPWFRSISPCAFWATKPSEPATTIDNHHPLLMVGGSNDAHLPYAGQLVMHHALHGSRMLTVEGSFRHLQFLWAGNACVDNTVQNYLLGAPLPGHDITCQRV